MKNQKIIVTAMLTAALISVMAAPAFAAEGAYPELEKTFSEWNEEQKEISEETCQSVLDGAKEQLEEESDYEMTFTNMVTNYVVGSDSHIVSILNKMMIPAGKQLRIIRIDDQSVVDLEVVDGGGIVRVEVNKES